MLGSHHTKNQTSLCNASNQAAQARKQNQEAPKATQNQLRSTQGYARRTSTGQHTKEVLTFHRTTGSRHNWAFRSFKTVTAGVHCSWHNSVIGKRMAVSGPWRTNTISSAQKTFATTPRKRRQRRSSGNCGSSEILGAMPWQVLASHWSKVPQGPLGHHSNPSRHCL